ncbi:MAG TPA: Gfo/Idh/MocA family oxidoreductase [Nitrospira sp.]|nr:Gfo/Idh/MocA family oxidoreductase [Nitrospira sp.]
MANLRVGVIGVGHLGQHHARLYASLPDSTLIGVVDHDHGRASLIGGQYGARVFDDLSHLLKHVDVVSVAVPTPAHYSVTKTCLEAGKHVLVEKPIAVLPIEAQELVELAKMNGCTLQVGHSERFNPIMRMMRPHIRRPMLFEGQRMGVYNERGTDVDVVLDLMIHDLDLVLSCHPGPVEEVRAAGLSVRSSTNDVANAYIQFESGCVASLIASRVSLKAMRHMRLFQPDESISMDFQSRQGVIGRRSVEPGRKPMVAVEEFQGGDDEPLRLQLESFLQAIHTQSCPVVSGEAGTAALEMAHRVLSAIKAFGERNS